MERYRGNARVLLSWVPRPGPRELAHQPALGELPVPHHGFRGNIQDLGRLFDAQAAEEPQLDHLGFPLVLLGERRQRLIYGNQIFRGFAGDGQVLVEGDALHRAATFGIRIILGACAVAAWTDMVVARQPEAPLPANLEVDPMFQVVVEGLRQRSPAFRRQIARIEAAQPFRVRVLPEERVRPTTGVDARTVFTFDRGALARAHIYLRMTTTELIAHEVEHIVEQLDGIDLRAQAGNGVVWKSHDNAFETSRAIRAGRLVVQEVARGAAPESPPVDADASGAFAAIMQRERDAAPVSEHTGRISANGRFVALISPARLVERDRNDRRDVHVFDGETAVLSLESSGPLGEPADGDSGAVDISADGRFLVFASEAGNLTAASFAPGTSPGRVRRQLFGPGFATASTFAKAAGGIMRLRNALG